MRQRGVPRRSRNRIKLYFAIGLPTKGPTRTCWDRPLAETCSAWARGARAVDITVSVLPLCPSPRRCNGRSWPPRDVGAPPGLLRRGSAAGASSFLVRVGQHLAGGHPGPGDRRLGRVIHRAWQSGAASMPARAFPARRVAGGPEAKGVAPRICRAPTVAGGGVAWDVITAAWLAFPVARYERSWPARCRPTAGRPATAAA